MSPQPRSLDQQAESFAAHLDTVVGAVVGTEKQFKVVAASDTSIRRIGPLSPVPNVPETAPAFEMLELRRGTDDAGETTALHLKCEYVVSLDTERDHLTVVKSAFGLWVQVNPTHRPTPVVRIEYDRDSGPHKPAAHVHLHTDSAELAWIYGSAGAPLPRLHEIHFPVGGRRFRPAIEDLLLFLDRERLFTGWATPEWRQILADSLKGWDARQAKATVRRHPNEAADQLRNLGYLVEPPL